MPVYAIDSNPRLPMTTDLKGLRELLKICVERENYEQAASIKRWIERVKRENDLISRNSFL